MDREQALKLVEQEIDNENLMKHMKAVEAAMRELAMHFDEDQDEWGVTGLLHDLDYERTEEDASRHGLVTQQMLEDYEVSDRQLEAIKAHAGQKEPENKMERAIYAADPLTGLIVAGALVHPEGLNQMDIDFVKNRFSENSFARSANRDAIRTCTDLGLTLDEFIGIVLEAMKGINDELGL